MKTPDESLLILCEIHLTGDLAAHEWCRMKRGYLNAIEYENLSEEEKPKSHHHAYAFLNSDWYEKSFRKFLLTGKLGYYRGPKPLL